MTDIEWELILNGWFDLLLWIIIWGMFYQKIGHLKVSADLCNKIADGYGNLK